MVAGPDAVQQVLHPGGGVSDAEVLLDPGPHLLGVVEAPLGDLLLELLDLGGSQPTGIAPVVQGTQLVQVPVITSAVSMPIRQPTGGRSGTSPRVALAGG